ncbi:hypothetical protein [uncultured Apibacter sp.]|uniref:hypothetical protein n=1 Tax=uncultured Apibacter sp. TaxID=1778616 RepID=UPI0025E65E85|nr:hypothetical protein [uncultured Apibacter sp.]
MYLMNEGQVRNGCFSVTNKHGVICESSYPPFGFVLNIDNSNPILELSNVTNMKYYYEKSNK